MWYTTSVPHASTEHDTIRSAALASDRFLRAEELGVSASAMSRMEHEGCIARVVPGIYIGARRKRNPLTEAAAWSRRYPSSVMCLLTAAVHHKLTDAFARGTWLYVAKGTSVPRSLTAPLHVVQIAPRLIEPGHDEENAISALVVHGTTLRITNADRTVLDLWRYPQRIPVEHALVALRRHVQSNEFVLPRFARLGQHLGVWSRVEPVLQGMMTR